MSEFGEMLKKKSGGMIQSPAYIIEKYGHTVTVNGIYSFTDKKGVEKIVLCLKEGDGEKLWATSAAYKEPIKYMLSKYDTIEELDAYLMSHPQRLRLLDKTKLSNGNHYWPIEFLGDAKDDT